MQELHDLRKAFQYQESGRFVGRRLLKRMHQDLGVAEWLYGNRKSAYSHFRKALNVHESAGSYGLIIRFLLGIGDFDAAARWRKKAERFMGEQSRWRVPSDKSFVARWTADFLEAQGKWTEAEQYRREAIKQWLKDPEAQTYYVSYQYVLRGYLVNNLIGQGRLVEAEIEARDLLLDALKRFGKYAVVTAKIVTKLARILSEQGRSADAIALQRTTIEILQGMGVSQDSTILAAVSRGLGIILAVRGNWQEAAEQFEIVRKGLVENRILYQKWFLNDVMFALTALKTGRLDEAVASARRAYDNLRGTLGESHYGTAEAVGVLGMALNEQGNRERALAAFANAIPILLSRSRLSDEGASSTASQDVRRQLIFETYISLLSTVRGTPLEATVGMDVTAESFRVADVMRSSSVQRALAASSARAAARDPSLADLARQEQDARNQISALYRLLAEHRSLPSDQQDPNVVDALLKRIEDLRAKRAAMAEQVEQRFPEYVSLVNPKPPTVAEVQSLLREGEALVAFYLGATQGYIWSLSQNRPVGFAVVPVGRAEIEAMVAQLRVGVDSPIRTIDDIQPFDVALAYRLYELLLKPVEATWKEANSLMIVPHGALATLPPALLPTSPTAVSGPEDASFTHYRSVPWLVRSHAVTVLPSVASLVALRKFAPPQLERRPFVGFADPIFSRKRKSKGQAPSNAQLASAVSGKALRSLRSQITAELAIATQVIGKAPDRRVVEEEGLHQDLKQVDDVIPSPQMDQFMGQDSLDLLLAKARHQGDRHDDDRSYPANEHRRCCAF